MTTTDHSAWLESYRMIREVRFRLNNLVANTISKQVLDDCGQILGILRNGVLVFDSDAEMSLMMDYCVYYPQASGRNLVADYLERTPPPADSIEMTVLQGMTRAYYSLFEIVDLERGVGLSVKNVLRGETGFLVDVGLGTTASRNMMLATRVIPHEEGFLTTGGAGLPVDRAASARVLRAMARSGFNPETFDFKQITPRQEAELAAIVIREARSTGMMSRVAYAEPGERPSLPAAAPERRKLGRNDRCHCGSGKKFKFCCGAAGW